jgi:hypothetical protein
LRIAVVGGTGKLGFGLALRLARAGHSVVIGSRSSGRAGRAVSDAAKVLGDEASLAGSSNPDSVKTADIVILAVPHAAQLETCKAIAGSLREGTVVVDASNPDPKEPDATPRLVSVAEESAALLPGARVVAGFQTIPAGRLRKVEEKLEGDVLLCGDDGEAKAAAGSLAEDIPNLRWIDAGPLSMARVVEQITRLLISINERYGVKGAGIRIEGLER